MTDEQTDDRKLTHRDVAAALRKAADLHEDAGKANSDASAACAAAYKAAKAAGLRLPQDAEAEESSNYAAQSDEEGGYHCCASAALRFSAVAHDGADAAKEAGAACDEAEAASVARENADDSEGWEWGNAVRDGHHAAAAAHEAAARAHRATAVAWDEADTPDKKEVAFQSGGTARDAAGAADVASDYAA